VLNTKGRIDTAYTTNGTTNLIFSYDAMDRIAKQWQGVPSGTLFSATYNYDYLGDPLNGSDVQGGIYWTNTYNAAGRPTQVWINWLSPTQSGDLISGIQYNAYGEPTSSLLGNGLQESWGYDVRGRLQSYSAGSAYSFSGLNWAGNGDLLGANDGVNGNWTYTYDAFNRLSTASQSWQDLVALAPPNLLSLVRSRRGYLIRSELLRTSGNPTSPLPFRHAKPFILTARVTGTIIWRPQPLHQSRPRAGTSHDTLSGRRNQ